MGVSCPSILEVHANSHRINSPEKSNGSLSGKRSAKTVSTHTKETGIIISNWFALLAAEEEEMFLISDSVVKEQSRYFGIGYKGKRKVSR